MSIDLPVKEQMSRTPAPAGTSPSWLEVWTRAIFWPSVSTFEDLVNDPNATLRRAILWIFFSFLISESIGFLVSSFFSFIFYQVEGPPSMSSVLIVGLTLLVLSPFGVLVFLLITGLFHWFARKLGGTGTYSELAFAFAAFHAPLMFIAIVPCLNCVLPIYGTVLCVMAIKAVYKFDWGSAIFATIVPALLGGIILVIVSNSV